MKDEKITKVFKGFCESDEYEEFYREKQPEDCKIDKLVEDFVKDVVPGECRQIAEALSDLVTDTGSWREQMGFRMGFKYGFQLACEALAK